MSRFVLGNCIDVMTRIPDNAIDFILTDPPYLVGFRDRSGRTIAGDKTDEWLQPACNEMFRVLKKDALMVSFYGWNRVVRFMAAWKMRDSALLVTWSSPKTTHRRPHMWAIATNAPTSWQKAVHVCHKTRCRTCWAGNIRAIAITRRKSPLPACNRSLRASHTRTRLCWTRLQAAGNGHHRGALPVPSVREGALLCPVLSLVTASML